jgi:hypothetical protein
VFTCVTFSKKLGLWGPISKFVFFANSIFFGIVIFKTRTGQGRYLDTVTTSTKGMSKATRISTLKMTRRLTAGSPQTPHPQTCYGGSVQKHSAPAPPSRASSSSCHFPCTLCRNNPPSLDCCHRHHPKNVELEWKRKLQRVLCVPMCSNLRWTMHCRWSPTQHGPVFPIPDRSHVVVCTTVCGRKLLLSKGRTHDVGSMRLHRTM